MIVNNIHKTFGQLNVLDGISFEVAKGEFLAIIGQTGCGKSTLLNILSGIESPSIGDVKISSELIQSYLLQENVMLPWRTLKENIELPLKIQGNLTKGKSEAISGYIQRFELQGFEDYYPNALSGGMKQRAALIRCLITEPNLILLDEGFSNLDFDIKLKIQRELLLFQKKHEATIVMVTHDIEDAIALSDQVIILSSKPTKIKKTITIDLGLIEKDPVLARKSNNFPEYFARIWDELKYFNELINEFE